MDEGTEDRYILFSGQDLLAPESGPPSLPGSFPLSAESRGWRAFAEAGTRYAAYMLDESRSEGELGSAIGRALVRIPLRSALARYDAAAMRAPMRGAALLRWLEVSRRCGACGGELRDVDSGAEDMGGRRCSACGRVFFPRISPAVILLIKKGDRALLAHNARFKPGFFGLIAGFVEAGETLEEAAIREAREEAGIEIGALRYMKSQSWPFPDSLMLAFTAQWVSGEAAPDGREIAELRWCLPGELPDIPAPGSVARYLLDLFIAGQA